MTMFGVLFRNTKLQARKCAKVSTVLQNLHNCRRYGIYEPDYLEAMKSKIPLYSTLNIQLKGYDFTVLESYQKFVHKMANYIDVDVDDGWATPAQKIKIERYRSRSTVMESEYYLALYERNVQISSVESTALPLLLQILAATLPEGVKLNVHLHEPEHEEIRYVPDHELLALKTQLETMTTKKK